MCLHAPHTDCFEHVQGANFVFFDGKSGYFGDRTMEMYHIRRGFKKYRRGGGAQYSDWSMFCACMPLTQTALSMYKEQILCFFLWKKWIFWGPHYGDVPY